MKAKFFKILKFFFVLIIIVGTTWFFIHEFSKNWDQLKNVPMNVKPFFIVLSFAIICIAYLINTYAWQYLINQHHKIKKIKFYESIAIVNVSQLTKYLPGKVWSFGLQMWWLGNKGFSKTLVLFVNVVAMIFSLLATSFIGILLFFITAVDQYIYTLVLSCIIILVVFLATVFFFNPFIKIIIKIINRVFRKEIVTYTISRKSIIKTQLLYLLATIFFSAGMYFICLGLGLKNHPWEILLIIGTILISDVIGFIVLISPGGLGVRESVMFGILQKVSLISTALIIPVATRILTMLADLTMGIIGLFFFRKIKNLTRFLL